MRALLVGCGSVGRRHLGNLLKLANIEHVFIHTKVPHPLEGLDRHKVEVVDSLDDIRADFAIVANETYKHLSTATFLAKRGINLFIEKPLSHSLEGVDVLKALVTEKRLKVFVGYNLRFLDAMSYIKGQLSKGVIGELCFARIEVGQYLPAWRPERDYRQFYSANREKGGGVSLDLSHEVDYMRFLFGEPGCWKVIKSKASRLEIDAEDLFEGIFRYDSGFVCSVHMDYLQREKMRQMRVVGSEGTLSCDFIKGSIEIRGNNAHTILNDKDMFDMDRTYLNELSHFVESIEKDIDPCITLEDGIAALRLLEDGNV